MEPSAAAIAASQLPVKERYRLEERFTQAKMYWDEARKQLGETSPKTFLRAIDINPTMPWWDPTKKPLFNDENSQYVYMLYGIYQDAMSNERKTQTLIIVMVIILLVLAFVYWGGPAVPPPPLAANNAGIGGTS